MMKNTIDQGIVMYLMQWNTESIMYAWLVEVYPELTCLWI